MPRCALRVQGRTAKDGRRGGGRRSRVISVWITFDAPQSLCVQCHTPTLGWSLRSRQRRHSMRPCPDDHFASLPPFFSPPPPRTATPQIPPPSAKLDAVEVPRPLGRDARSW